MVITVMFNHPTYVTFCITHLFLFETMFSPFQPALYLKTTAEEEKCFPRRLPHIQDGRFHLWNYRLHGASLPARPIVAMSCAIGFLPVEQQQLDGVLVPVA